MVAADTIVTIDGVILGKPADAQDAKRMLRLLSGRTHQVATGVCVARANAAGDAAEPVLQNFVEVTDVTFYALDEDTIDEYAQSGEPLDKAGAYGIQGKGGRMLVEKIDGDFYNVVGLPIARVARTIRDMQQD